MKNRIRVVLPTLVGAILLALGAGAVGSRTEAKDAASAILAASQQPAPGRPGFIPGISVFGDGEARAEPDIAIFSAGATHVAQTAEEATDEVNRRAAAVVAAARAHGLQDRDIQTSGISLQPITRPRPGPEPRPPEIEGYRATNSITLIVRDIGRASAVLDSAASSGANVVGGLRFATSNAAELRARALGNAVRNAAQNAQEVAGAAGVGLGEVLAIVEQGGGPPTPRPVAESRAMFGGEPTPVEPGELVVRARVRMTYAISS